MIIQGPFSYAIVRRREDADKGVPWTTGTALERKCYGCTIECNGGCPLPDGIEVPKLLKQICAGRCAKDPRFMPLLCKFEKGCQEPCPFMVLTHYLHKSDFCQFYPGHVVEVNMSLALWWSTVEAAKKTGVGPERFILDAITDKLGWKESPEIPAYAGFDINKISEKNRRGGHSFDPGLL